MMTTKLRLLAVLGVVLGLIGGAGAGIYFATAADPAPLAARASDPTPVPEPPAAGTPARQDAKAEPRRDGEAALLKPVGKGLEPGGTTLEDIFKRIESQTELVVRVDVAAFRRVFADAPGDQIPHTVRQIYETKAVLPRQVEKLALCDLLADSLAQVPGGHQCTYKISGGQIVIVPAYAPAFAPGVDPLRPSDPLRPGEEQVPFLTARTIAEQIYGGVVNIATDRKPLAEILSELRKQTGANIVLDPRCEGPEKKAALTVTLNDVRLYDAIRVLADMADLKMVYTGNIYYVTTAANAKPFQPPAPRPATEMSPQPAPPSGK